MRSITHCTVATSISRLTHVPRSGGLSVLLTFVRARQLAALSSTVSVLSVLVARVGTLTGGVKRGGQLHALGSLSGSTLLLSRMYALLVSSGVNSRYVNIFRSD